MKEPPRADAVQPLLVFLHLLEGESERATQLLLAHPQRLPPNGVAVRR